MTKLTIDLRQKGVPFEPFWCSTGFTPSSLLFDADIQQTLEQLGSIPRHGIQYVRIHFLLELVRGSGFFTKNPDIDWSLLDRGLDVLIHNGLKPIFELMGNPGRCWTDFKNPDQVWAWRRFVASLARHCIDRYGRDEVRSWYFETWNEPDLTVWWTAGVPAFLNYYDACSAGLADADRQLKFGGPGTAGTLSEMFTSLMAHVDNGKDFFTGKRGVRIDFISVHEKGTAWSKEDVSPDLRRMCERELKIVEYLRKKHPRLANLPFMNDECDPQIGWSEIHTWHATAYYAATSAKGIVQHLRFLREENRVNYLLLGHDNCFFGGWGVRTYNALLTDRRDIYREMFDQVKKPFHNMMELLTLLGDKWLQVAGNGGALDDFGCLATRLGNDQVAVLLYHANDRVHSARNRPVPVTVTLDGLPFRAGAVTHYRIADGSLPYDLWERRHPDNVLQQPPLTAEVLQSLRDHQELECAAHQPEVGFDKGRYQCSVELVDPSVHLLLFTRRPARGPAVVRGLQTRRYWGTTQQAHVLLRWTPLSARTVRTYEVLYAPTRKGHYRRLNKPDLIVGSYLHAATDVRGWYKVRAVDYWGRASADSEPVEVC